MTAVLLGCAALVVLAGQGMAARQFVGVDQANAGCGLNTYRYRRPRSLDGKAEQAEGRIIGGSEAGRGEWPWQVSIQLTHPYWGFVGHWCGGVLVDSMWVITGAHCLVNRLFKYPYPPLWTVVVGEHNLREIEGTEQTLRVQKIVVHSLFQEYHNDVALLKLAQPVLFGRGVAPICLPASNATRRLRLEGVRCMATGWGQVIQGHQNSITLQRVEMPLVSMNICRKAYEAKYKIPIKKYHVCAGNVDKGSKGTCVGDSGGPLQCPIQDGRWYLIGVTSFGSGCVKPGFPDVFTRITYYIDWIHESIQKYSREKKRIT